MTEPAPSPPRLLARAAAAATHLRSPESGLLGQGVRFAFAGAVVAGVYFSTTLLLARVAGLPFQAALALGFLAALATHFTLQRLFVWTHHEEFALALRAQVRRYLAVAFAQYALTAAATGLLPGALNTSPEAVYIVVVLAIALFNFVVFRTHVFHARG